MNPASVDIKDMLEGESSLGLIFATDLFVGKEPSEPSNCVTIFDTPGYPDILTLEGDGELYSPSIQIRVRNTSYLTGWDLANDIRAVLHGKIGETWNGSEYDFIKCTGGPFLLDWDENDRARFVINLEMKRR